MNHIEGLIVILGSPNDQNGELSPIGQGRVARGYAEYLRLASAGWKILLTGGFGAHFNMTDKPHAYYAQQLLLAWGVPPADIVEFIQSSNTVEDALLARGVAERYGVKKLVVVSSDFHMGRVKFIFAQLFPPTQLSFAEAEYLPLCSAEEQQRLLAHEERALECLRATLPNWLV